MNKQVGKLAKAQESIKIENAITIFTRIVYMVTDFFFNIHQWIE